jgi:hypothetical protein
MGTGLVGNRKEKCRSSHSFLAELQASMHAGTVDRQPVLDAQKTCRFAMSYHQSILVMLCDWVIVVVSCRIDQEQEAGEFHPKPGREMS